MTTKALVRAKKRMMPLSDKNLELLIAYLQGRLTYNQDGTFSNGESVSNHLAFALSAAIKLDEDEKKGLLHAALKEQHMRIW